MTRTEVVDLITTEFRRALGANTHLLPNLRETEAERQAREQRVKEARRAEKQERRERKESLREARDTFERLGMDPKAAKLAARGRDYRG